MHCRATKVLGSRMQHGNAQPTAAHALQGKRNAWVVGCDEDNAQPTAAYAPQRKQNAWTVGCPKTMLGRSDATVPAILFLAKCKAQIVVILFVVFSSVKLKL